MSSEHWLVSAAKTTSNTHKLDAVSLGTDAKKNWNTIYLATELKPQQLVAAVADYFNLQIADLSKIDDEFARRMSESDARTNYQVPLNVEDNHAVIAMADPADTNNLDQLAFTFGMPIIAQIASPGEIQAKLEEIYDVQSSTAKTWGTMPQSLAGAELVLTRKNGERLDVGASGTSKLFKEILRMAIHLNASDAHIQPYGEGAVVRNRVDGVLHKAIDLPSKVHSHLTRHVKAISGMDPTKSFIPQDGELSVELEHQRVDLRLSVLPVESGERLVMRLLPQGQVRSIETLKLQDDQVASLHNMVHSSAGLILVTGPTGSGKSSLMYAMLAEINTPDINIMTVEQPVEYRLRGASQISVEPAKGLTFAFALRSILRQDPDVVMVGEIRDEETATIAAQAALTGHLVLSTVHTLDGLSSMSRMVDLGVTANTMSNALRAIIAQRLVRKLCAKCKAPIDPLSADEETLSSLGIKPIWAANGCTDCNMTGYSGRLPVVEIIEISEEIQSVLRENSGDLAELELLALRNGTRFLAEAMADRIEEGVTTVKEVIRVYGRSFFAKLEHYSNLRKAIKDPGSY
ncbi:MAG: GspE/PulE family protein [Pseudomonadales bacterium]|nr:GspE/PulE family protein [Pseudomonadales bacterium]MDG1443096.1 GspE/PulE family protein [Pseudomonadales bacterium]